MNEAVERAREEFAEASARDAACFDDHGGDCYPDCGQTAREAFDRLSVVLTAPYIEAIREYVEAFDEWNENGWGPDPVSAYFDRIQAADDHLRSVIESSQGDTE